MFGFHMGIKDLSPYICIFVVKNHTVYFRVIGDDNRESYILAMRQIHYHTSYPSNSDRDDPRAEWTAMEVHSLSEDESPCLGLNLLMIVGLDSAFITKTVRRKPSLTHSDSKLN